MKNSCIVGYGAIGPYQAQILKDLPDARIYSICDNDDKKLNIAAKDFPDAVLYKNFEDVLKDENIDVVHVCTPHYLHIEMVEKALKAGKNVLLEKPVCISMEELERMKVAEANSSAKLGVIFQNRTNPSTKKLLEEIPLLGKIKGVNARILWQRDAEYYKADEWRGKWATEGGGLLINQAIHTIDIIGYIFGGYTAVTGSVSTKKLGSVIEVEDTADAIFETKSGAEVMFFATNCYTQNIPIVLEIQGEEATLRLENSDLVKIEDGKTTILTTDKIKSGKKSYWGVGHGKVFYSFYRYLETGEGEYLKLKDVENTMRTLFAFYESSKKSERVEI